MTTMTKAQAIVKLDDIATALTAKTSQIATLTATVATKTSELAAKELALTAAVSEHEDFVTTVANRLNTIAASIGG